MACPACRRDDFANQQGFLNHCRISHGLEFGPYEQIMLQCGTPVDEAEVPLDNPARLRPVLNLTSVSRYLLFIYAFFSLLSFINRALQKKKERPTIKEYEEEIDMDIGTDQSQKPQRIPTIAESYVLPDNNQQEDNRTEASKSLPENQPSSNNSSSNSNSNNDDDNNNSNNNTNTDTNGDTNGDDDTKVESIAAALSVPEIGSRFYIKRRIIVGNVSKFISPGKKRERER